MEPHPLDATALHGDGRAAAAVEPGLLAAFRLMLTLQLLFIVVGGSVVTLRRMALPSLPVWVSGITLLLLLGYLSWPLLQRRLGRFFLPLALAVTLLLPLVDRLLFLYVRMERVHQLVREELLYALGWRNAILLLIPLVLIAWQYNFRRLLIVAVITVILDWCMLTWFFGLNSPYVLAIISIVLGEGLAFLTIGYIVTRMMAAQRQQRHALAAANHHLVHYATTIEQLAISHERNRLARELHDTLAHTLSALAVQLEAVDSVWEEDADAARTLLVKSLAQTRSGLMETRRALQALRASPLEDLGLVLALRTLAESVAARTGATLHLDLPEAMDTPSPDVEQALYRIGQEALSNVTKHAAARHLAVRLQQTGADITLTITDDGQGFDATQLEPEAGYGLRGLQERATLMGATLQITSTPGQGTTVAVQIAKGVSE
ncbi:MAG: sensor histidine kinase [Caldilineaceae bacterium]|nr:sensor histidine kinase [Caldilineaceae bacterium]